MRDRAICGIVLLLDENLSGRKIVTGLTALNIPVKPQTDIMERGLPDTKVLELIAKHDNLFLITKDSDFHRKSIVKKALIDYDIGTFVITSHKGKTAAELVALIKKAWNRIQKFATKNDRPFVAKILSDGRVKGVLMLCNANKRCFGGTYRRGGPRCGT